MINDECFLDLVDELLGRNLCDPQNSAQLEAVTYAANPVLQIVAGPGSGKTTVLILRALRSVLVDDVLPEHILITTFTRKAARELRSRWLEWGMALYGRLSTSHNLDHIDLNRCAIDTLDSVIQTVLSEFRQPGTLAPMVVEPATSLLTLKRQVFPSLYWSSNNKDCVNQVLRHYTFSGDVPRNQGEALTTTKRLLERLVQDRVDLTSYSQTGRGEQLIVDMLVEFRKIGLERNLFDFTMLEEHFLERLSAGELNEWANNLRVVLIDEYQDTNPLQEAIYFSLIMSANPSMSIVGDDDQAMYRFRGGSVELFTDFALRCRNATSQSTTRVDMVQNFRSTPEIISFFNRHIRSDPDFQSARMTPPKPQVVASGDASNVCVVGMFRPDEQALAVDLADFIHKLVSGQSIPVGTTGEDIRLSDSGALGDAVFLSHSVEEINYNRYNGAPEERFPGTLRQAMGVNGLQAFNPRGQPLRNIPEVQQLLGLVILSIDPDDALIRSIQLTSEAQYFLNQWRSAAQAFVNSSPAPDDGRGLNGFIQDWQQVARGNIVNAFPSDSSDWPVLELIFKLITCMPSFQSDPESQVWLEAITRTISSAAMESAYGMQLLQNVSRGSPQGDHITRSRRSLIRDALVPIAEGDVQVDEDIIPSVPRDRLQFMTIHQSKGLEFPLVIVNVGSRFSINHARQRFLRFPDRVSNVVREEDDMESHLPTVLRGNRSSMDRTFDDLVRLYYVAYSRPQSVLMLVGHENNLRYGKGRDLSASVIPNLALGWNRDGSWPWRQSYSGRKPPARVDPPLWEV